MKIALVHDDLVQWGGAERVLATISEIFPDAPIYTSVLNQQNLLIQEAFQGKKIITSFIQSIPGWKNLYKTLLPLYPLAFEQFDFSEFDVVISQSTRFSKAIITKPTTFHICYCHTPPRFLWNFYPENLNLILKPYLSFLRVYDQVASNRVDKWIAGSFNTQMRLQKIYDVNSTVVQPFVDTGRFNPSESFEGGYLLVISRLNSYKRVDLAVQAANFLHCPLKVVGIGPEYANLVKLGGPSVEFLGSVSEDVIKELLGGCKALIICGEEDFGMTSLEAQAMGKPVVAFGKGGSIETVIEGQTGYLFAEQETASLISALKKLEELGYNKESCIAQARKFSKDKFIENFLHQIKRG